MALEHYREVVERIRASATDVIVNLTTGPGGRFIPSDDDPKVAAPGSNLMRPEERVEHVLALRPEICSLDLNTMWFGTSVVINTPRSVTIMAEAIRAAGVKPELEVFDSGDIQLAHQLLEAACCRARRCFSWCSGSGTAFRRRPRPCSTRGRCCRRMRSGRRWAPGAWSSRSSPRPACSAATSGSASRTTCT